MTQPNPQPLPNPGQQPSSAAPQGNTVPQYGGMPAPRHMPQAVPQAMPSQQNPMAQRAAPPAGYAPAHPSPMPQQHAMPQGQPMHPGQPMHQGQHMQQGQPMHPGQPMHAPQNQAPQHYPSAPQGAMAPAMPSGYEVENNAVEGGEKALPQISIHAFCDRNETAGTINESTRDWRMKRTTVKIYMGGLLAAIEYYHKESTPNLIMVETGLRGGELFNQLEQLASVCDPGTNVVIIGAANDIKLYRQLMDKGVSDYLVPPFHPLSLIRSLGGLYSDPDKPFVGRTTAFYGAKGGVGSSTFAHNVAWCMSEIMSQDTALVDLDASWGTTGLDFNYDASQGLEEALAAPERLDETLLDRIMLRHTAKLSILPTAGSLATSAPTSPEAYEAVVNAIRGMSPNAILDMPHYWTDWTIKVLTTSDDVVLTATPDLANLRNTKNLIDYFKEARPNDQAPILILNKVGMTKTNEISVKDFAAAVGLEPALVIGFDPDTFTEAANDGKMLTDIKNAGQTVTGLTYIAERLKTGSFDSATGQKSGGKAKSLIKKNTKDSGKSSSIFSKLKLKR